MCIPHGAMGGKDNGFVKLIEPNPNDENVTLYYPLFNLIS